MTTIIIPISVKEPAMSHVVKTLAAAGLTGLAAGVTALVVTVQVVLPALGY